MSISKLNPKLTLEFLRKPKNEDQYFDKKSSRIKPKDLAPHVAAFANANGGTLAIGISDDGKIEGFNSIGDDKINEFLKVSYDLCTPTPSHIPEQVSIINENGQDDHLLLIHIKPSTKKIIKTSSGEVYLRVGDSSKHLKHDDITKLEYDKGERLFEETIVERSSISDIDKELMQLYREKLGSTLSDEELLDARGLLVERDGSKHLTTAGVLLFSKSPDKFYSNARLRFIRYDGTEAEIGTQMNIIKDISITGPIHKLIEKAKDIIGNQLREFTSLDPKTGIFSTVPEYPEFAWQEGIVNALTHRDYSQVGEHIKVIMYDDRLEIQSPGKLPNIVNLKNLKNTRYSRNPVIARVLSEFGWVKELNEGVKRIYKEMSAFFLDSPEYFEPNSTSVLLVLKNNVVMRKIRSSELMENKLSPETWHSLREEEKKAMEMAFKYKKVTTKALADTLGRSNKFTRNILSSLHKKGLLGWNGTSPTDPQQYYYIEN